MLDMYYNIHILIYLRDVTYSLYLSTSYLYSTHLSYFSNSHSWFQHKRT